MPVVVDDEDWSESSADLSLPVTSSRDSVEISSRVSMERRSWENLGLAARKYFLTTFSDDSGSPSVASWVTMPVSHMAKSSTDSPS